MHRCGHGCSSRKGARLGRDSNGVLVPVVKYRVLDRLAFRAVHALVGVLILVAIAQKAQKVLCPSRV